MQDPGACPLQLRSWLRPCRYVILYRALRAARFSSHLNDGAVVNMAFRCGFNASFIPLMRRPSNRWQHPPAAGEHTVTWANLKMMVVIVLLW